MASIGVELGDADRVRPVLCRIHVAVSSTEVDKQVTLAPVAYRRIVVFLEYVTALFVDDISRVAIAVADHA